MFTNVKEEGLEDIIVEYLVESNGYELGNTKDYNLDFAVDEGRLIRFSEKVLDIPNCASIKVTIADTAKVEVKTKAIDKIEIFLIKLCLSINTYFLLYS